MDAIRFILGIHAHQRVGSLPLRELLAEAPRHSSLPFLEILKDPSLSAVAEGAAVQEMRIADAWPGSNVIRSPDCGARRRRPSPNRKQVASEWRSRSRSCRDTFWVARKGVRSLRLSLILESREAIGG
jgi:hypothetical protein